MKLKNIMNDVRQLRIDGQVIQVGPKQIIEIESTKIAYDESVFKEIIVKAKIETQKRNEMIEKPTKQEEVK